MNYYFHKIFALSIGAFLIAFLMLGKFSMADEYKISSSNTFIAAHERVNGEEAVCNGERGEVKSNPQAQNQEHSNHIKLRIEQKRIQFRTPQQVNANANANAQHARAPEAKKCL